MYKPPVELLFEALPEKMHQDAEGLIVSACLKMGVNVDLDELKKLIAGDRETYERGYKDGYEAAKATIMEALERDRI